MKSHYLLAALIASFFSVLGYSQTTQPAVVEDFKPSELNQPGQEYPMVNSQGYARFRIVAPAADSVKVSLGLGGRGGTRLTKGSDGIWTGTTEGPMDEGFHYYHINIDGGTFNDPGTLNFYGSTRWESGIEIPAHDKDFYAQRTTSGIHRDELEIRLGDQQFRQGASQGQRKSLLFALKLAEFNILSSHKGFPPILLLDDVFEKLDAERMHNLLEWACVKNKGQVFLTDTHCARLKDALQKLNVNAQVEELF